MERQKRESATEDKPGMQAKILRTCDSSFKDVEVCILVTYCPTGVAGTGINFTAQAFLDQGITTIACLICEEELDSIPEGQLPACSTVLTRLNAGYDFGAWAGVLRAVPELWQARRIYFVNDSIVGPNSNFEEMIESIRANDADFTALTASRIDVYHAQSYFFVYGSHALQNYSVQKAWCELPDYSTKKEVIKNCEQTQLRSLAELGMRTKIVFNLNDLIAHATDKELSKWSPTHHLWKELCLRGFPFLKVDIFHRPKWRTYGWEQFFSGKTAEAVRCQVRESITARNALSRNPPDRNHQTLSRALASVRRMARRYGKLFIAEWRFLRG